MRGRGTPRISARPPEASSPAIRGERGRDGAAGAPGPAGQDSPLIEISESASTLLMGVQPHGFVRGPEAPLQCGFEGWDLGDILVADYFIALEHGHPYAGICKYQVQVSFDSGSTWYAVRGSNASIGFGGFGASASASVALELRPLVRLHAAPYGSDENRLDYGSGPDGSSVTLRCYRTRAGTYEPAGALVPPRP